MTMKTYAGVKGAVKQVRKIFAGVNGSMVGIKEIYAGINGDKQLIFKEETGPFPKLEITNGADVAFGNEGALPRGRYYDEYNAKLKAIGGDGCYCFSVHLGHLFEGLELKPDGTIWGIPTSGGAASIYFRVKDGSGNIATKKLMLRVSGVYVNFDIRGNYSIYDCKPHTIIKAIPSDPRITDDDFVVTLDGAETQVDAGHYDIAVKITKKGFSVGSISSRVYHIDRNNTSKISLVSQTVAYDGQPHGLIPTVLPVEIQNDYKVTYKGSGSTIYAETEQPPTAVGTYTVKAETTSKNYTVRIATATLTISE